MTRSDQSGRALAGSTPAPEGGKTGGGVPHSRPQIWEDWPGNGVVSGDQPRMGWGSGGTREEDGCRRRYLP